MAAFILQKMSSTHGDKNGRKVKMKLFGKLCAATVASTMLLAAVPTASPVAHAEIKWGAAVGAILGGIINNSTGHSSSGSSNGGLFGKLSNQKHAHPNPTENEKLFLLAVKSNDFNTVQSMLDAGVDINGVYFSGKSENALMDALYNREMMQFLLERGADVNGFYVIDSEEHWSYLNIAAFDQDYDTVKYLLDWGANPNDAYLSSNIARYGTIFPGGASLHFALSKALAETMDRYNIVELLLDHGANPDSKNRNGETAYIYAVKHNSIEVIRLLAKGGADLNARDEHGRTAMQIALDTENIQLYKVIQEINALGQQPSKYKEMNAQTQKKT